MASSSFREHTQIVAQAVPDVPRFERVALLVGAIAFLVVLAIGLALYLAKFQVDARIVRGAILAVVLGAATVFFASRPASKLTPTERMIRSKRVVTGLIGLMAGVTVLGLIATAAELNTARDWLRLAMVASSPIAVFLLLRTRFTIG